MEKADIKRTQHPNFILGLVSVFALLLGVVLKMNGYRVGDYILIGTAVLGTIHWIWSIIDVIGHQNIRSQSKVFWVIMVVVLPMIGGMLYYSFSRTFRM